MRRNGIAVMGAGALLFTFSAAAPAPVEAGIFCQRNLDLNHYSCAQTRQWQDSIHRPAQARDQIELTTVKEGAISARAMPNPPAAILPPAPEGYFYRRVGNDVLLFNPQGFPVQRFR